MAGPITGPDLLTLRATIVRVDQYGGVRGDKPLILRQAAALLAEVDRLAKALATERQLRGLNIAQLRSVEDALAEAKRAAKADASEGGES
jgi:hypothetical protein